VNIADEVVRHVGLVLALPHSWSPSPNKRSEALRGPERLAGPVLARARPGPRAANVLT
jgi:hypothetical protein